MRATKTFLAMLLSACATPAAPTYGPKWVQSEAARQMQMKQFDAARRILEVGAKQYARSAEIWNLLGIADAELGLAKDAASAFQRGLAVAPNSSSLNENIGLLFYRNSDFTEAKKYLTRAVELQSNTPGVLFSLAASQLRTGEQAKALMNLKALEPVMNESPAYWEERGRAELLSNAIEAEADFDHALRMEPASLEALNGAASAAEHQGLDERALSYLIKAKSADPNNPETLLHFGAVCIRRDLGPDAIEALEKARQLEPQNIATTFLLARAHISVQDWQKAYDLFQEYARRAPNDASVFYALGWVATQLGWTDEAMRQLEHCLALNPAMADARYELARMELDQGEFVKTEKMLQMVLKQEPGHAKAQMAMGELLLRRNELDGAQAYLERAIQLDSKLAPAHYKLSTVLFRKHEEDRAAVERALAVSLEAENKRASKTQLKLVLPEDGVH